MEVAVFSLLRSMSSGAVEGLLQGRPASHGGLQQSGHGGLRCEARGLCRRRRAASSASTDRRGALRSCMLVVSGLQVRRA